MGSSLMPFASRALPAATLGARTAQIAGRGLLEGLAGGFGYSREGKELQDTAVGGAIGMGGELLGNYALDPSYRSMVNNQFDEGIPGKYSAALQGGGNTDENIYYHQSQSKEPFTEFRERGDKGYKKADYSEAREGIYFSPDKELVQSKYGKNGGQLIATKLEFKNKLDLGEFDAMYFDGRKVNTGDIVVENFKRVQQGLPELPEPDIQLSSISKKAKNWLLKNGYDVVEGMKGEMWSAPEAVVLDKSIIKPISEIENLDIPLAERLADSRTLGESTKDDTLHFAKIEGEGFGPEEYIALGGKELPQPKEKFVKPKIKTGTLNNMSKRLAMGDGDTLESFLEKYRRLGIIK
jgi:hypothetical protein